MRHRLLYYALVAFALVSTVAAADDIELQLDKNVADKFLSQLGYPYTIVIPQRALDASGDGSLGEVDFDASILRDKVKQLELDDVGNFSSLVEGMLADELKDPNENHRRKYVTDPEVQLLAALQADSAVMAALKSGNDNALHDAVSAALKDPALAGYLEAWIKKRVKLEVSWVRLRIKTKPVSEVSSPIELRNMKMDVQARFRACIKLFGKWRCVGFTTPRINLEARKLSVALSGNNPPVLYGHPSFSDLDIVVKIRIFGIRFKVKIGITKIVNKQLRKNGPVKILDLSGLEFQMPGVPGRMVVETLTPARGANGLLLKANLKAVPK